MERQVRELEIDVYEGRVDTFGLQSCFDEAPVEASQPARNERTRPGA